MDKKKGKAKPTKPITGVVDKEYESYLDLKVMTKQPPDAPIFEEANTITSEDDYYVVGTTIEKAMMEVLPPITINKKPVKKKGTPATMLKLKKAPPPRKPYSRIIREEDFKFPRVRKQNTLRVEREPQVRMEEDEFRDIEALEIKIG